MICIFGCLLSNEGKKIKAEMMSWLKDNFSVFCVDKNPPNLEYEYPFLEKVIDTAIQLDAPVLYVHTKGAANTSPKAWTLFKSMDIKIPTSAIPADTQTIVRKMWEYEFTKNLDSYLAVINTNEPIVACPYTGDDKTTWQNGFIINSAAARELKKSFHKDKNRYYYERMFKDTKIKVVGIRLNNVQRDKQNQLNMWIDLWSNFYTR